MSDKTLLEAAEAIVELYTLHGECTFCGIGDLPQGQCSCPFGKLRATLADSADAEETADLQKLLARIDGYEAGAAPEGPLIQCGCLVPHPIHWRCKECGQDITVRDALNRLEKSP